MDNGHTLESIPESEINKVLDTSISEDIKNDEKAPDLKESVKEETMHLEEAIVEDPIVEEPVVEDTYYKLYKDINENFSCDISIEGASPENSFSRIIVETKEWSLVFDGTILNGKCNVPIKKLGILKEGDMGTIKLEVVAEGNLFVPWSDTFKVKLSKKVTVNLDESKKEAKQTGISVSINR
jgi:hypothetical protein